MQPPGHSVACERIAYGPEPFQFGELRTPEKPGPYPVLLVLHGGFWRAAYDLEQITPLCQALTALGFTTWNVEYRRLGNGGGWPVTFHDVALAARRFPNSIAVGHSAGGHLALLLAHGGLVSAAVSLAGVADLQRAGELGLSRGVVLEFLNGHPCREASPIDQLPARVPLRLIHGLNDDIVPHEIAARYADAARAAGDDVELLSLPDTGHFELVTPSSQQWPEVYRMIERISAMVWSNSSSAV